MESLEDAKKFLEQTAEELNFAKDVDRNEMYKMLIDFGNELETLPEEEKTEENFVKGCTSNVYISAKKDNDRIKFEGSADAMIVKGYLAILIKAISGLKKEDVAKTEELIEEFIENTDVKASLTPSRANAFGNIYKTLKEKAANI
ncbi:MAG: SufE family protein [Nanoarchaeota archaeon]